jgi:hypothetical protein
MGADQVICLTLTTEVLEDGKFRAASVGEPAAKHRLAGLVEVVERAPPPHIGMWIVLSHPAVLFDLGGVTGLPTENSPLM